MTVAVDAVVYYKIYDATMSITKVENASRATRFLAQTTLRNVLGTRSLSEILSEREAISHSIQVNKSFWISFHPFPSSFLSTLELPPFFRSLYSAIRPSSITPCLLPFLHSTFLPSLSSLPLFPPSFLNPPHSSLSPPLLPPPSFPLPPSPLSSSVIYSRTHLSSSGNAGGSNKRMGGSSTTRGSVSIRSLELK